MHNTRFYANPLCHNSRSRLRISREYICINSYANSPCQLVTTFPMAHTRIHESHKSNKRIERFNTSRDANVFFKLSTREEFCCRFLCIFPCCNAASVVCYKLMFLFHHLIFPRCISVLFSALFYIFIPLAKIKLSWMDQYT